MVACISEVRVNEFNNNELLLADRHRPPTLNATAFASAHNLCAAVAYRARGKSACRKEINRVAAGTVMKKGWDVIVLVRF